MTIMFKYYYGFMVVNKKLLMYKLIMVNTIINFSTFYLSKSAIKIG
jgi:hypothetical protein